MMRTKGLICCVIFGLLMLLAPHANAAPQLQPLVILTIERSDSSFSVVGETIFRDGYLPRGKPLIPLPFTLSINDNESVPLHKTSFDFPWLATEGESPPEQQKRVTLTLPWPYGAKRVMITNRRGDMLLDHVLEQFSVAESTTDGYVWVAGEGNPDYALKIAFVGDDYEGDVAKFAADAEEFAAQFLATSPISEFQGSLLIYRTTMVDDDLGCGFDEDVGTVVCDSIAVHEAASAVPYDEIIVLYNFPTNMGSAMFFVGQEPHPATFAVIPSFYGPSDSPAVSHEAGHSMFALMDEYIVYGIESVGAPYGPNCDYEGCENFADIPGAECLPICGFGNLFRASDDCVMFDLHEEFCPVCSFTIRTILSQYDAPQEDTPDDPPDDGDGEDNGDNDEEGDDDTVFACEEAEAAYETCKDVKSVFACMSERRVWLEECF